MCMYSVYYISVYLYLCILYTLDQSFLSGTGSVQSEASARTHALCNLIYQHFYQYFCLPLHGGLSIT